MISVNYSHLCEKAFLSQNGNLNLIGIFEKVAGAKFPLTFPHVSIVSSLRGEPGQHQMVIKIINKKDNSEVSKPITLNLNIQAPKEGPAKAQNLRIIGDINNLTFKELGEYEVQIFLNNEQAYTIPFSVQKVTKPIPEGR